jgi:MFS superfamily sulfate permease-like transporter
MAASFLILARVIGLGFLANFLSRTVLARMFHKPV